MVKQDKLLSAYLCLEKMKELEGYPDAFYEEDINTAIECIEKQIPKKPTHTYKRCGFIVEGCCPTCGVSVAYGNGCSNNDCLQAIDWSDNE